MNLDLSFFTEPPERNHRASLEIIALAPLSMVSSQPGSYFRSEITPTTYMLLGLLENALGWHFDDKLRRTLFKVLQKHAKKKYGKHPDYANSDWLTAKPNESGSGFFSLLDFHLAITEVEVDQQPLTYDDLWSMQLRSKGENFIGGSRNYDRQLEGLINLSKQEDKSKPKKKNKHPYFISFGDKSEYKSFSLEKLLELKEGKVKTTSLKPYFPHYYSSPKTRGYIIPKYNYKYRLNCTSSLARLLELALSDPAAPLYLGSNDGWVEVKWINHE
ncbi:MAG: hypothetical protein H6557_22835 [Lewinellaceae bacterium]|nr:hypothetical protein [Phaeodactylibacter sp.]MCB9039462.1 hypothetical protein [Lewinellaceae bacterium]